MNKTRATFLKTMAVLCAGVMAVCPTFASASEGGYAGSNYSEGISEDGGYAGSNYTDIPEGGGYAGSDYTDIPEGGGYAGSDYTDIPEGGGYAGSNYTDGSDNASVNNAASGSNQQVSESELATWTKGLGSACKLDGNIVVVSIFVNDHDYSWNFSDSNDTTTRDNTLTYLGIATDWITECGKTWNKEPKFIYDWKENTDLYYEATISCDITDEENDPTSYVAQYIQNSIDEKQLLTKYDADSIVYVTYLNTSSENKSVSFSIPYTDDSEYTQEVCYMLLNVENEIESPAGYAHEILHVFGAPDLYTSEDPAFNCNIDDAYVKYCKTAHANDIMETTYDVNTGDSYYDHISNELSDVTAYYIGWTDTCKDVTDYNLQQSHYILTGTYESAADAKANN